MGAEFAMNVGAMLKQNHDNRRQGCGGSRGFSLIELMIVVAILGILAAAVGVYLNNDDAKLRSFVFNLASRVKQAKFEAMKRGHNVCLDFDFDGNGVYNSYTMWMDNDADNAYDETKGDLTIVKTVSFEPGVEFYDAGDATITGGPKDPAGGSGDADITDGFKLNAHTWFQFKPSGDSLDSSVYLYYPRAIAGGKKVSAGPLAIVVNTVGRIRIDEWMHDKVWKKDNT